MVDVVVFWEGGDKVGRKMENGEVFFFYKNNMLLTVSYIVDGFSWNFEVVNDS